MIQPVFVSQPLSETPAAIVAPAPAWVYSSKLTYEDSPRDPRCSISYIGIDGTVHYYDQIIYNQGANNLNGAVGTKINCPPSLPKPSRYSFDGQIQSRIRENREEARNQSIRARSQ